MCIRDSLGTARHRRIASGEREFEVELTQPVTQRQLGQGQPRGQRPERGVQGRQQRGGDLVGIGPNGPPPQLLGGMGAQLLQQICLLYTSRCV